MDLLLSTQENGSLRVVNFNKFNHNIHLTYKNEFLIDKKNDYIKTFLIGNFKNKSYLVVARVNGLIQLYEKIDYRYSDSESDYEYDYEDVDDKIKYQLFKEWKNSNVNDQDQLLSVGFINNQYLYSCSIEGKLIIRDLINDDANQSYKVYFISNPISCIEIKYTNHEFILAISSKNHQLKLYKIQMTNQDHHLSEEERLRLINLSRLNSRKSTNLVPYYMFSNDESTGIKDWICSIIIDNNRIYCGTQFGNLMIFNLLNYKLIYKTNISRFKINLVKFNNYIIFNDSMTKIGIFNCLNFIVESKFSIDIGPLQHIQFYWNHIDNPIYFVVTTLNQDLKFYKLFDNEIELLINLSNLNSSIPCFCVLNYSYQLFDWFFNNGNVKSCPKRRNNRLPSSIKKKKITIDHKEEDVKQELVPSK